MEKRILSDEKIHSQYDGFRIVGISIEERDNYFVGTIDVSFPNATHEDFDDEKIDNFISYDSEGREIAFDYWYPEDVYLAFCDAIRKKRAT